MMRAHELHVVEAFVTCTQGLVFVAVHQKTLSPLQLQHIDELLTMAKAEFPAIYKSG